MAPKWRQETPGKCPDKTCRGSVKAPKQRPDKAPRPALRRPEEGRRGLRKRSPRVAPKWPQEVLQQGPRCPKQSAKTDHRKVPRPQGGSIRALSGGPRWFQERPQSASRRWSNIAWKLIRRWPQRVPKSGPKTVPRGPEKECKRAPKRRPKMAQGGSKRWHKRLQEAFRGSEGASRGPYSPDAAESLDSPIREGPRRRDLPPIS